MAKIDLADGYYCAPLLPAVTLGLVVFIPSDIPHNPLPLIAIPLMLPMGWSHSPPFFCAFTEMVTDTANTTIETHADNYHQPHPTLQLKQTHPLPQWQ
jgi:hypothetical protein